VKIVGLCTYCSVYAVIATVGVDHHLGLWSYPAAAFAGVFAATAVIAIYYRAH